MVNTETLRKSQNSFAGGEIGPKVLGRVDLAKFNVGLRFTENVIVDIEGSVSNRGGFEHGGQCFSNTGTIRFIPFEAAGDVPYVIEATDQKFRFIFNNDLVVTDALAILEVTTPYLAADLYKLVFTQTNDIMTITGQGYAPRELRRTAANAFSLVSITVNPTITPPTVAVAVSTGTAAGETQQGYCVSTIDAGGNESLPSTKVFSENDLGTAGDKIILEWSEVAGADAYIVYKRRAGQFGFLGYVRAEDEFSGTTPTRIYRATDQNINPNTSLTPKREFDPFPTSMDYPAVCFLFQQRRAFAASVNKPNSIINSQTGIFNGFKQSVPAAPDDYFEFALGAARTQQIKHVVAVDDLIIFTQNNEWRLRVDSTGYLASQPPDIKPQSGIGISDIPPLVVGTDIMYVQASKRTVYRMNYSFDFNKFISDDISILSKQMFRRRKIVGWCYAQQPQFVVFAFFDDGQAAFFAYNREQEVYAWTRCKTDGLIDACASVRENGVDKIYIAVRRQVGGNLIRYFERMDSREFERVEESFFVDSGVSNIIDGKTVDHISGGEIVTTTPHGLVDGDFVRVYGVVGSDPSNPTLNVNSRFRVNFITATSFSLEDFSTGVPISLTSFEYLNGGKVWKMGNTIGGMAHLEGKTVSALADGFVYKDLVVTSGGITLPILAGIRTAGLPYRSEIQTLELEQPEQPTRGRKKSVAYLVARVEETRGIKIGLNLDKMYETKDRDYEPYEDPTRARSEIVRQKIGGGWKDELALHIVQDNPLPMTVLSVIPEYTVGD